MEYQRVLIVSGGRINADDATNGGLLQRNIFGEWPRENLAQIFSSGDNGDVGFCGRYYRLGARDRHLGWLFYRLKAQEQEGSVRADRLSGSHEPTTSSGGGRAWGRRLLLDTGLYELVFRPRLSSGLQAWVRDCHPEIIFATGYSLTFTWLPLMLSRLFGLPIVYYTFDDWPCSLYHPGKSRPSPATVLGRRAVQNASRELVNASAILLAFNRWMQEEYTKRYGKEFTVLMHGDEVARFDTAVPRRLADTDESWIVSMGSFNQQRWSLVRDLESACELLSGKGLRVRASVFAVNMTAEMRSQARGFRRVSLEPCPVHRDLPAVLCGADVLFLPEAFGDAAAQIRLSVSSKAHLFMFSGRPIIVYSGPEAGVARYAKAEAWASVVDRRDPQLLADAIETLLTDMDLRGSLVATARRCASTHHDLTMLRARFCGLLTDLRTGTG